MYRVRVRTALISDRSDLGLAVGRLTASSGSAFSCGSVFVRGTRGGAVSLRSYQRNFAAVKAPRDSTRHAFVGSRAFAVRVVDASPIRSTWRLLRSPRSVW